MKNLKNILIKSDISIKHALKRMDSAGKKVLFVVNNEKIISGAVSDGDIRRWILKKRSLDENISKVMNKRPLVLKEGYSKAQAKQIMLSKAVECIPIVDQNNKVVSAVWWLDIFDNKFKNHKIIEAPVVIMAGGEGARLLPFTSILPKPLVPIGDKPIIELIMDRFIEFGCKKFYLSLNYKANIIKAYFKDCKHDYEIKYINERMPLGTAGSLHLLRKKIDMPFFVSNCDVLIEADYADILHFHKTHKNKITLVCSLKHYAIPYGVCKIENGGTLNEIKEKPEYDFLVNTGMYVMEPDILNDIPRNKFYNTTDLINNCLKEGKNVGAYPVSEKSWLDMGQWEELQKMVKRFNIQ